MLIICLINVIFGEVICENVLDIYLEIFEKCLVVCFCVDGVLCEVLEFKCELVVLLVLWIKVMVWLDIVEKCIF